jgi:hypothetical protein
MAWDHIHELACEFMVGVFGATFLASSEESFHTRQASASMTAAGENGPLPSLGWLRRPRRRSLVLVKGLGSAVVARRRG